MIAVLIFLNHLLQSNQLTTLFNLGFSILKVTKTVSIINLVFALIVLTILSPIGNILLDKYKKLDKKLNIENINVYNQILLKEEWDNDPDPNLREQRFIYIDVIDFNKNHMLSPMVLTLKNNIFYKRLECKSGSIRDGFWQLTQCIKYENHSSSTFAAYSFKTKVTKKNIINYIKPIYNVPIWQMPGIISTSEKLGMQTNPLKLHYYKQLFKPLLIILMALVPFFFFNANKKKIFNNIVDSLTIGFCIFLCINICTNILMHYINSAMMCNILPIAGYSLFTIYKLREKYRYPIT
jgi:lipopolysaccharide export LptBFGC system permease protein LptF